MFTNMKSVLGALAFAVLCHATAADATVLTFDTDGSYASYTEAGMTINPILGSSAVTISGSMWNLPCCNAGNYDFEFVTGGRFDLLSMDFLHTDSGDPVTLRGFRNGSEIVSQTINQSNAGLVNFVGFTDVDRVTYNAAGTFRDPTMDNLTYEARAVPEPATIALLGLGVAGLGFARRRRA